MFNVSADVDLHIIKPFFLKKKNPYLTRVAILLDMMWNSVNWQTLKGMDCAFTHRSCVIFCYFANIRGKK
jgi:hypothetical protein